MTQAKEQVLKQVKDNNVSFDGSSIEGFARIDESDMVAMPDPSTFQIFPVEWSTPDSVEARMFCDVVKPGGEPFDGDPRNVLKKNLKRAADMGYTFNVGAELEFFYFNCDQETTGLDNGGYFDLTPLDMANDLRRNTVLALEGLGSK